MGGGQIAPPPSSTPTGIGLSESLSYYITLLLHSFGHILDIHRFLISSHPFRGSVLQFLKKYCYV